MKRARLLLLLCAVVVALVAPPALATLLDEAYAKFPADAAGRTNFAFVVLGDSRHWTPVTQPETFREIVREANLLRGALMVDVGDLILGYSEHDMTNRMWDEFEKVVRTSEIPFIPVAGNHDVSAPMQEEIYQQRIGALYFSFDYGNAHFICLDGDQVGVEGIGPEQLAWLKADLEATAAQHIFVFLHEPYWRDPEMWDAVHALLAAHKVEAVFAGHEHHYELFPTRDGVRYFISGGGGAELGKAPERGGFHHFLWVAVEGPNVYYAVVKPGAILPIDIIANPLEANIPRLETQLDGREIRALAEGMAKAASSPAGPVMGAAEVAHGSQGNLRQVALALIASLANTQWVTYLPSLVHDPDPGIAGAAFDALLASKHPQGVAMAKALLPSSDENLARRAALALALNDPAFPQCLRDAIPDSRKAAELAETTVAALAGDSKIDDLVRICDNVLRVFPEPELRDVTLWVRWREARALQNAGLHQQAVAVLEEILRLCPSPDFAGDLVPESLMLQARSLAALGQKQEALAISKRLQEEFSQYSAAVEAAKLAESLQK